MPDPITAITTAGSQLLSSDAGGDSGSDAANIQAESNRESIAETRRQFDFVRELLKPYVDAGGGALTQQQSILGLRGADAQRQEYDAIQNSEGFQATARQGENAMLQNASATGGLRGGNIQGALGQFRPQLLQQFINDRYGKLGGLTTLGQQSAVGVGNAGMATGAAVSGLLGQEGAALAGGALANGRATAGMYGAVPQGLGAYFGATGQSPFSGLMGTGGIFGNPNSFGGASSGGFGTGAGFGNQDIGLFL